MTDLIGQANRTMMTASLANRLLGHTALPADARLFLEDVLRRNSERNRRLLALLAEVAAALNELAVEPIPIKGAALLLTDPMSAAKCRILNDLDLILPASAMSAAADLLVERGFRVHLRTGEEGAPIVLFRDADVGMIDLHCRMKTVAPLFDHRTIAPHCSDASIGGSRVLLPSRAMQAAILIAHDQLQELDYWRGVIDVRHLADLADLAASPPGIDWAQLDALFPGVVKRAVRTQLLALHRLFAVPVPRTYRRGSLPWLQHHRRVIQARFPGLRRPFTWLSLMLEMPRVDISLWRPSMVGHWSIGGRFYRLKRVAGRSLRPPSIGKYG